MKEIGKIAISVCVMAAGIWAVKAWNIEPGWAFVVGVMASNINRLLQILNGDDE